MTKYNKARQIVTFLESLDNEGEILIKSNGVVYTIKDEEKEVLVPSPIGVVTPSNKTTIAKPVQTKSGTLLKSIQWGKPGSKPRGSASWGEVIIPKLQYLGFNTAEELQDVTFGELQATHGIKGIAPIIKDSLNKAGFKLKV